MIRGIRYRENQIYASTAAKENPMKKNRAFIGL